MIYNVVTDKLFDGEKIINAIMHIKIENGSIIDIIPVSEDKLKNILDSNTHDLRGKFVTAGLIDSHNHFMLTALKLSFQVNMGNISSYSEFLSRIAANRNLALHGWLQGYAMNEYEMKEEKLPDKKVIDRAISDIPVFITHVTEHYAVCNSKALEIAGINKNTNDPENGRIGRDVYGIPDGRLYEAEAMDLVKKCIPEYNLNDYEKAIIDTAKKYSDAGLTAVKDTGGTGMDINERTRITAFNNVTRKHKIPLRLNIALPVYSLDDVDVKIKLSKKVEENSQLKFGGFKLFLDGSIMSRTAWMKEPYKKINPGENETTGISLWNMDNFKKALKLLAETETHISIHVIGDMAIETAIDTIEEIEKDNKKAHFALVHSYKLNNNLIEKIKNVSADIETQAAFIYFIGNALQQNLEDDESKNLFPLLTLKKEGIKFSNGSDSPVTPFSPVYGIYSCIYRKIKNGNAKNVFDTGENISPEDALKSYTSMSADITGWNKIGYIKPGFYADFTIWDKDPEILGDNIKKWEELKLQTLTFYK